MLDRLQAVVLVLPTLIAAIGQPATAAPRVTPSNAVDVGLQDLSGVRAVVALETGGALYAVTDNTDILVRPVDADGSRRPAVSLTTVGRSEFGVAQASMARLSNGNVAAAWVASPGPRFAVFARVVRPDGSAISSELTVTNEPTVYQRDATVAALDDRRFVIGWSSSSDDGKTKLNARIFTGSGVAVGAIAQLSPPAGVGFFNPVVAPCAGGFIMAYNRSEGGGVFVQRFDGEAAAIGGPRRLDDPDDRRHEKPVAASLASGGCAVMWEENVYGEVGGLQIVRDRTLKGRFLNEDGSQGARFGFEDPIAEDSIERTAALVSTPAGLLAAWHVTVDRGDSFDSDIRGAILGRRKAGRVTTLTKKKRASEFSPRMALITDGRVALGYSAATQTNGVRPVGALGSFLTISGQ